MKKTGKIAAVLFALMLGIMALGVPSFASDDNSLASLGINTEGVTVTPDFAYDTWEYNVTVPAGTTELSLSPIPSSSAATIAGLSGTTLNADGTGTVYITVQAGNGDQFTYTLYVTGGGPAPQPQPQQQEQEVQTPATDAPQPETQPQTEAQTEDNKYVRVERNTIQEAENTITNLKADITRYRDTISMYTKIMYGLIAVAVVLLFIVINLILKKKDLKAELNEYRSLGYSNGKKAQKAQAAAAAYAPQGMKERQNHPQPQSRAVSAQEDVHYTNGGQLDVRPQTSQKKSRKLPEYQGENAGAAQAEAAAMQKQAPVKPQKPSRKQMQEAQRAEEARLAQEAAEAAAKAGQQGKGSQVQVDMIDL